MHPISKRSFPGQKGFTIIQTLIVIIIIAILMGIAITNVFDYYKRTQAMSCANNIRNIQAAKNEWIKDYPQTPNIPNAANLISYLKSPIPTCPQGGTYANLLNCEENINCSRNGDPGYEPNDALPLDGNGYHDLKMPK